MSGTGVLGMTLLVLVGFMIWIFSRSHETTADRHADSDSVDANELSRAEEELSDLDWQTGPDEADEELPDWGPGVPKSK